MKANWTASAERAREIEVEPGIIMDDEDLVLLDALKRVVLAAEEVALPGVDKASSNRPPSAAAHGWRAALARCRVEVDELLLEALEADLSNDELPLEAPMVC